MDVRNNQICLFCGKYFKAYRATAKYCSDKCRAAAHRQAAKFKSDELYIGTSMLKRRELKKRYEVLKNFDNDIPVLLHRIELEHGSGAAELSFEIAWKIFQKYIEAWNKADIERIQFGDIMASELKKPELPEEANPKKKRKK